MMMIRILLNFAAFGFFWLCNGQYTSQTFPDPRLDPLSCRVTLPGPLCDPSGIIPQQERIQLVDKINQLLTEVGAIGNTAPACEVFPGKRLEIFVAMIEKIGTLPTVPVDIEKFTNSLKARYQNFKDVSTCDNTIVIVNSKNDRQVYTVAGRDVKLTRDILKNAFVNNIQLFKDGQFATGLLGMVEFLITAYKAVHGSGVPSLNITPVPKPDVSPYLLSGLDGSTGINSGLGGETDFSGSIQPAPPEVVSEHSFLVSNKLEKPEDDSDLLWSEIMQQAIARCGSSQESMTTHVHAIVDEAMSLSLKLITDPRYTQIEESIQNGENTKEAKATAWNEAKTEFIDKLYRKYENFIRNATAEKKCPAKTQEFKKF